MADESRSQLSSSLASLARPGRVSEQNLVPPLFRFAPFRADPALVFQAVERGIKRSLGNLHHISRHLLDALRDVPAMLGFEREGRIRTSRAPWMRLLGLLIVSLAYLQW
jgi:hypothetical protein